MKRHRVITLFAAAVVLLAAAAAAAPFNGYADDPIDACGVSPLMRSVFRTMYQGGFKLVSWEQQPINYFVQPTGDYDWGTVTFTFRRSGSFSTETEYCTMTVDVEYYDGHGFSVERMDAQYEMVY